MWSRNWFRLCDEIMSKMSAAFFFPNLYPRVLFVSALEPDVDIYYGAVAVTGASIDNFDLRILTFYQQVNYFSNIITFLYVVAIQYDLHTIKISVGIATKENY